MILLIVLISGSAIAQRQSPLSVALNYLDKNRESLGLTETDLKNYRVSDLYQTKHNGVTHVYLNQQHEGIDVRNAITNVNVLPTGKVLSYGNRFVSNLAARANSKQPGISARTALKTVINDFDLAEGYPIKLQEKISERHFIFDPEGIALEPVTVKLAYEATKSKAVRLVWNVVLYELGAQHWWNVRVDAQTGKVLSHDDQVIHCDFGGNDNCASRTTFHKNNSKADFKKTASPVNSMLMGGTYNVYPMPIESPNHGGQSLVMNPADPTASPFGWHDINGEDGAEYTITRGNNVHAYHDIFNQNGSMGDEPDGGDDLIFDFPHDEAIGTPFAQVDPAVVNLFYWNNTVHDVWYGYGFDEVAGNFQANNYGNGGAAGDYVRAEALDGGGTNNANFAAQGDGSNSRMQMFMWTNEELPSVELITISEPASLAGEYAIDLAAFGGSLPADPTASEVVMVDDGTGTTSDACEALVNGADLTGKTALIDRGDCEFGSKALKAQNEGAIAVIICNNEPGLMNMGPGADGASVNIPVFMVSLANCNQLKMGLPGLTVVLQEVDFSIPQPGPTGKDGDFDNGIIVHEYAHGISIRLTGGPSNGGCLTDFEQAGEGWSDWFALVMQTTSANSPNQRRGIGTYAIDQNPLGGGIRDFPYSRSMNVDPHTYADINSVSVPHGVGSVWAAMIWDLYWNLVDLYGFDDDLSNGTGGNNIAMQLVLDGLKMQPCNPNFLDARDAILAADQANNGGANQCLIWETFARRGLGFSAMAGGLESFDMPDFCIRTLKIKKTASLRAEAGELISYSLSIRNDSEEALTGVVVTDMLPTGTTYLPGSSDCPNTSVDNGVLTIEIGDLEVGASISCGYELKVGTDLFSRIILDDDIENGTADWTSTADQGLAMWSLNSNSFEGNFAWFAPDVEPISDQLLTTSAIHLLDTGNPALTFWHRYLTEREWDGGVVEISTDDGASWTDLGNQMVLNGYNGDIRVNPASPISGRPAFNGSSGGYLQTIIDLSDFAGQEVRIRFRMACDEFVDADGWYIDNVLMVNDFHTISNSACITSNNSPDEVCSEITSIVTGTVTSTSDVDGQSGMTVFPNPAQDRVYLNFKNPLIGSAKINLLGIDGRMIANFKLANAASSLEMDVSKFPAGVYMVQVITEEGISVQKVVVQ